jgi:signal transduction histidine kinase
MDREARRLSLLVDNLLEFSRNTIRHHPLSRVAIGDLLTEARDAFMPLARERGTRVEVDLPEGLVAMGDRQLLRQVLFNLLDNATKHGPAGQTITVSARCSAGGDRIEVAVSDQGPGVAPAHRERVWERFWRAPGSAATGFGVGLAVVRELVHRQGGEVAVGVADHTTGLGARFSLSLRAASAADELSERSAR